MTAIVLVAALSAAAVSGCVCVCGSADPRFESACLEQGGRVRAVAAGTATCVVDDAGVVATWVVDDADGGD